MTGSMADAKPDATAFGASADHTGQKAGDSAGDRGTADRQAWLRCLAHSDPEMLEAAWRALERPPSYEFVRPPETGLAMVRARMGGTGGLFNLGEMTVTRCAVRFADGRIGIGYVAGRAERHAALIALFDGLLQDGAYHAALHESLIAPLAAEQARRRARAAARAARTKVDFFTMVRGD